MAGTPFKAAATLQKTSKPDPAAKAETANASIAIPKATSNNRRMVNGEPVPLVTSRMANGCGTSNSKKTDQTDKFVKNRKTLGDSETSPVTTLLGRLNFGEQKSECDNETESDKIKDAGAPVLGFKTDTVTLSASSGDKILSDHKVDKPCQGLSEVERLKKQLDAANDKIFRQDNTIARQARELSETRPTEGPSAQSINSMQDAFIAQRPSWNAADDSRSETSDAMSSSSFQGRSRNGFASAEAGLSAYGHGLPGSGIWSQSSQRPFVNRAMPPHLSPLSIPQPARTGGAQVSPLSGDGLQTIPGLAFSVANARGGLRGNRTSTAANTTSIWAHYPSEEWSGVGGSSGFPPPGSVTPLSSPIGMMHQTGAACSPHSVVTPLSATAADFNSSGSAPWDARPASPGQQIFVGPAAEPLNYRRMLDKCVTCDWKYIVDKIVHNNDQQASIFLQQKLKVGTVHQKFEMVQAIIAQAYPLMTNRFGNFLVQRCFEHSTPEQVAAIANSIRGKTLQLSMNPFGCHVVQKAFDSVPEEFKAIMVHELLSQIPDTVVHRYACHVWQKLFELRWSDSPPQIMIYVNKALQGMWHEVALGETGSLVVQNIFENCLEEDKRPCINEVLDSIDIIAHGQFGNWCIQHICEHGAPADRTRAIDHVLKYATEYSMDQFASKVVEKCLKIGGSEFLDRYLTRVCEGRPDRPRIPLIDIASDQYGNYLIQYILTHASAQHRELVASHIRKHMVSLRGSKFGSRVGMLCSNPGYATRPGPGMNAQGSRVSSANAGFNPGVAPGGIPGGPASASTFGAINTGGSRFAGNFR